MSAGTRRLTIGGYTDPQTKRMSYVRRDDANTVAKVLEAELAPLLRRRLRLQACACASGQ